MLATLAAGALCKSPEPNRSPVPHVSSRFQGACHRWRASSRKLARKTDGRMLISAHLPFTASIPVFMRHTRDIRYRIIHQKLIRQSVIPTLLTRAAGSTHFDRFQIFCSCCDQIAQVCNQKPMAQVVYKNRSPLMPVHVPSTPTAISKEAKNIIRSAVS